MADVTIKYKGATIAEMSGTSEKTLKTGGTYCEGDIDVVVEQRFKTYYVNVPTAVASQFVTVVSGDPDVAAHYADDAAFVTVRKMTNNTTQGTAMITHGNHSFGGSYGGVLIYKSDGTRGADYLNGSLTTDFSANGHAYVRCTSDGVIKVYAQRLQNNFGGADYIITFSW